MSTLSACALLLLCCSLSFAVMDTEDMIEVLHRRLIRVELTQAGLEVKVNRGVQTSVENELRKQFPGMLKSALRDVFNSEDFESTISRIVTNKLLEQKTNIEEMSSLANENKARLDSLERQVNNLRYQANPETGSRGNTSSTTMSPNDDRPGNTSSTTAMPETVGHNATVKADTGNHGNTSSTTMSPNDDRHGNASSTTAMPETDGHSTTVRADTNNHGNTNSSSGSNNNISVSTATTNKRRRLLVLPWKYKPPVQVDIYSLSSSVYPLPLDGYQTGLYDDKLDLLFTAVINPQNNENGLYVSPIDSANRTSLMPRVHVNGIAFDDKRNKLILSTSLPIRGILESDIDGKNAKIILDYLQKGMYLPHGIDYDPVKDKIYACTQKRLISMNTDGSWVSTLHRGRSIQTVTIDTVGRWLFFNDGSRMMQRSLRDGSTFLVNSFTYLPWSYVFFEENGRRFVFVSSVRNMIVERIELSNRNRRVTLFSRCSRCEFITSLVLIP